MINITVKKDSKWRQLYAPEPHIRYVLVYGPRLGGKSYRASQAAMIHMDTWSYFRGYMMRNVLDTVRDSIHQDCVDRITEMGLPYKVTDLIITNGYKEIKGRGFKKSSGKDTAKQKSLAGRNFVLIEEAEEIDKDDFNQLDLSLRTTKGQVIIVLVFNPPEKGHWILNDWFDLLPDPENPDFFHMKPKSDRGDTAYIFSNYKDNLKHLDEGTVKIAERLKDTDLDYYLHKIVGLVPSGKTGRVFTKYNIIPYQDYLELPYNKLYGLDFGSNDPTTLIEVMVHDKDIYIDEQFYEQYLTIDDIDEKLKTYKEKIIADSQAKQTISTLFARGHWLEASVKGADSVVDGIRKLRSYNIYITDRSTNARNELENYVWKLDKFGFPTDTPVDKNNHAIDAIRYAIEKEEIDNSALLYL